MNNENRAIIAIAVLGLVAMGCSKKEQPSGGGTDDAITADDRETRD
ncbi:MAG: hypothetical protein HKN10_09625 [Myxococcales bacterium]|nr:hypothetical protein [Myxococcales bacterium]